MIVARTKTPKEPDLLRGCEHYTLIFTDLDGHIIQQHTPPGHGWNYQLLEDIADALPEQAQRDGWDAYLGDKSNWIGSSEV